MPAASTISRLRLEKSAEIAASVSQSFSFIALSWIFGSPIRAAAQTIASVSFAQLVSKLKKPTRRVFACSRAVASASVVFPSDG